jgi:hypothetical protein
MFETIFSFFMLPIVFWLFVGMLSIIYIFSVENDKYIFSIIFTIIAGIIYFSAIVEILSNWQSVLLFGFLYFLVGSVWSIYRWFRYCKKFVKHNPGQKKDYYESYLDASERKKQITGWIVYWPWSALWYLVGDLVTSLFEALHKVYVKISNKVIEKATKV